MRTEIVEAVRTLETLNAGDAVTVTDQGRTYDMTVSRSARRSDGAFGSVESTNVTVTFGPGRYAFEVRAELIAAGKQTIARAS